MAGLSSIERTWGRFGSMINTGLLVAGAVGAVYGFGQSNEARDNLIEKNAIEITRLDTKIEEVKKAEADNWTAHLQLHKDRLGDVKERDGRYEQRFANIEKDLRRTDQLELRLSMQEQQQTAVNAALKETNNLLNSQAGDIKVVKEILQRLEAGQRKDRP